MPERKRKRLFSQRHLIPRCDCESICVVIIDSRTTIVTSSAVDMMILLFLRVMTSVLHQTSIPRTLTDKRHCLFMDLVSDRPCMTDRQLVHLHSALNQNDACVLMHCNHLLHRQFEDCQSVSASWQGLDLESLVVWRLQDESSLWWCHGMDIWAKCPSVSRTVGQPTWSVVMHNKKTVL